MFEVVKPIAAKKGLDIKIVEFTDYVIPNAALEAATCRRIRFKISPISITRSQIADTRSNLSG